MATQSQDSSQFVKCKVCGGTGWRKCGRCCGTGKDLSAQSGTSDCSECLGLGSVPCEGCGGRGYKRPSVEVPLRVLPVATPRQRKRPKLRRRWPKFRWPAGIGAGIRARLRPSRRPKLASQPVQFRTTTSISSAPAYNQDLVLGLVSVALILLMGVVLAYGFERALVAGEVFFLFSAWAALRAARFLKVQRAPGLEGFVAFMTIGFGLSSGLLAAYLLLTTPEGQAITGWVTDQTIRIVASLFVTVFALGFLESGWQPLVDWLRRRMGP